MVDQKLLDILVCPETKSPLKLADKTIIERINKMIGEHKVKDRSGKIVRNHLQSGLVSVKDSSCLYPVIDEIPVLLTEQSIPLDQIE